MMIDYQEQESSYIYLNCYINSEEDENQMGKNNNKVKVKCNSYILKMSSIISEMKQDIENIGDEDLPIPLPNVSPNTMELINKIVEHENNLKNYHDNKNVDDNSYDEIGDGDNSMESGYNSDGEINNECTLTEWQLKFFDLEDKILYELTMAFNYLGMKEYLNIACKKIAMEIENILDDKTFNEEENIERLRAKFKLVDDFSPEEREKIKKDNEWIHDDEAKY